MATWLAEPIARFRAIIEGTYPVSPVAGRSVTAGRIQRATYRDDPASLEWPGTDFHRRYLVTVAGVRNVAGAAPNHRTGRVIKSVLVNVAMGYVVQPDGRITRDGSCPDEEAATQLAAEDTHELEEALCWPDFWAGTTPAIVQIRLTADVTPAVIVPRRRVLVTSQWDVTVDYVPGQVWA